LAANKAPMLAVFKEPMLQVLKRAESLAQTQADIGPGRRPPVRSPTGELWVPERPDPTCSAARR
jgi:hypothetical protein